jgi:hypothetical protein
MWVTERGHELGPRRGGQSRVKECLGEDRHTDRHTCGELRKDQGSERSVEFLVTLKPDDLVHHLGRTRRAVSNGLHLVFRQAGRRLRRALTLPLMLAVTRRSPYALIPVAGISSVKIVPSQFSTSI